MVDALQEIWRVLRPLGILIDLRPRAAKLPLDILYYGDLIPTGWIDDSRDEVDDIGADEALMTVTGQGYFSLEQYTTFPYLMYWDTLEELRQYTADRWRSVQLDEATLRNAHRLLTACGPAAKLRTHREVQIARYRK